MVARWGPPHSLVSGFAPSQGCFKDEDNPGPRQPLIQDSALDCHEYRLFTAVRLSIRVIRCISSDCPMSVVHASGAVGIVVLRHGEELGPSSFVGR